MTKLAPEKQIRGILTGQKGKFFVLGDAGEKFLEGEKIWGGYITHWLDKCVYGRYLPQKDYDTDRPIALLWPDEPLIQTPYIEVYYLEQMPKYRGSLFGHIAVNISGEVFNFSHKLNENEAITTEEYFYRPALGEFAAGPKGRYDISNPQKPYYSKFGRRFMRTIHALRIEGLATEELAQIFHRLLNVVKNAPRNPMEPDEYQNFNFLKNSCVTIIRDGLRQFGLKKIRGLFPRDLFVSCVYELFRIKHESGLKISYYKKTQLKIPEAPYSQPTPILNPLNYYRWWAVQKSWGLQND